MLSAFLMGEPIPWLCCNVTIPTYIIVWTLINYFPGNLISKLFCRQPFFLIIRVLDSMSWGHAVTTWGVDKVAMSPYSYSYVFRIAVGSFLFLKKKNKKRKRKEKKTTEINHAGLVSGSGGGFLNETFNLRQTNWSFNTPKHYMGPSFGVLVTLATSIFYSFAVDHTDEICEHYFCLTPEPLKLLVIAILTPIYFSPFLEVKQVLRRHSKRRAKRKARASQERESQERNSVDQN